MIPEETIDTLKYAVELLRRDKAELESQLAEATTDNAALLEAMKRNCFQPGDVNDVCIFCEAWSPWHGPACILLAEHPGSRLLERLETANKNTLSRFTSIETDPERCGGKPVLLGTRFTAAQVLSQLAAGDSVKFLEDDLSLNVKHVKTFLLELGDFLNDEALAAYDKAKEPKP